MPYRVLAFLSKKASLTTSEFISYYETKHIPLIVSLSGDTLPAIYKRRYTHRDEGLQPEVEGAFGVMLPPADGGAGIDCDAITELVFVSLEAAQAWMERMGRDGNAERVQEDEERFLDRGRTKACVVEEFVTRDEK
jgi:hypothetical protein